MTMRFSFRLLHAEKMMDGMEASRRDENVREGEQQQKWSECEKSDETWSSSSTWLVVGKRRSARARSYSRRNSLLPPVCRHLASLRLKLKSCSISLKFNQQKLCSDAVAQCARKHDVLAFGSRINGRMTMCLVCVYSGTCAAGPLETHNIVAPAVWWI